MGATAARILSRAGEGRVSAVFRNCFYCEINGGFICIGSSSLGMCPLNVITTIPGHDMRILPGVVTGMAVRVSNDCVRIEGRRFLLEVNGTGVWRPVPPSGPNPDRMKRGLAILEAVAVSRLPEEGLGCFIATGPNRDLGNKPVLKHAAGPLKRLQSRLRRALADPENIPEADISSWQELLGLGPGLTPSGDDLIGGIMLGLHTLEQFPVLRAFSSPVARLLAQRTNPISAAHLREAMAGAGSEVAHSAINAILSGDRGKIVQTLSDIEKYGHTSGWDMLAGIVIVFRLWLESPATCQSAA